MADEGVPSTLELRAHPDWEPDTVREYDEEITPFERYFQDDVRDEDLKAKFVRLEAFGQNNVKVNRETGEGTISASSAELSKLSKSDLVNELQAQIFQRRILE